MRVVEKTETTNLKVGKIYNKDLYLCETDDIWVTVETPKI
jgi:hypothetical protein